MLRRLLVVICGKAHKEYDINDLGSCAGNPGMSWPSGCLTARTRRSEVPRGASVLGRRGTPSRAPRATVLTWILDGKVALKEVLMNKAREREILRLVYGDQPLVEVIEAERPDFIVRLLGETAAFGIEVTEWYYSESAARLDGGNYVLTLLHGGDAKHKEDRRNLIVDKIEIRAPDGTVRASDVTAIIQTCPSLRDCARGIARRVERKGNLVGSRSDLSHTNLIIRDKSDLFSQVNEETFFSQCFTAELRAAVCATKFREVYLVAKIGDRARIAPLCMLLLLSEFFFFRPVFEILQRSNEISHELDCFSTFASYFGGCVAKSVGVRQEAFPRELIFGDAGLQVGADESMVIRLYSDRRVPNDVLPTGVLTTELSSVLGRAMLEFRSRHRFESRFCLEVAGSSDAR
jgi:hypothetical protein